MDLKSRKIEVIRKSNSLEVDSAYLSVPKTIEFPTENKQKAHGFYYPPNNKDCTGPSGELPPLIAIMHGGPTSATDAVLDYRIQFWTSRGFAVFDINYGGSTGYGTEYRRRLNGRWGEVDLNDCENGARYLAEKGYVDFEKMAIRGGSAGGYTVLSALTFGQVYRTGASYYGVSDLEILAKDTHKFESRYLDKIIGPYPESVQLYRDRSPLYHLDKLGKPIIFFQGLEDKIVPPNQAVMMVEALRKKDIPVAYIAFEGEEHGFREAKYIKRATEAELFFYAKIFGFEPADPIEPVNIENL
jgi:dipeptidyl aminopeptidase/acylaminoacyl peptidase